ncbi:putative Guanine nucleotide-binding protein negative regulator 1 [Seiridium unicorne]|uniref:Guanine nucleotide-binding protein negative regulator 1 n=1 Tax=Seiridium unicorne TaxID=138068 RepID=A0ABR2V830_9PEZI
MAESTDAEPSPGGQTRGKTNLVARSEDISTRSHKPGRDVASYFEAAHWTADGTTVLTSDSSDLVSAYVLPPDLLKDREEPLSLSPQVSIPLGEPTNVLASAPSFNLSEAYTNQILVSSRDHPIQLYYLFPPATQDGSAPLPHAPAASYPLIKARSETFLTATSLLWSSPGSHFIAGCKNFLARFDVSRTGQEPVLRIKTIPSERHLSKGGGVGMRGTISTLSAPPSQQGHGGGLVAAGTWTRWIGLYDFDQAGECASTWSIESAAKQTAVDGCDGIHGDGISQTLWSPCGRYLLVSERKSRGILVYDVRVTGQLLGWLEGRDTVSNQRITCDVFPSQQEYGGFEVWSGTGSGTVKVWEGVGLTAGAQEASWDWQAHESTVSSTCLHPTGTVIATSSGSWEFPSDTASDASQVVKEGRSKESKLESRYDPDEWLRRKAKESNLKIWSLGGPIGDD